MPLVTRVFNSYQMFETNMDEYLDEEVELVKRALEVICKDWEREVCVLLYRSAP